MATIENNSNSKNYMAGNKVFLLDNLTADNTTELIGRLAAFVDQLKPGEWHEIAAITNPYILETKAPILDFYIKSGGGDTNVFNSLSTLMGIARAKGAHIRTTNMGMAHSAASMLAVQGDVGLRIMYENATNLVHFGKSVTTICSEAEIKPMEKLNAFKTQRSKDVYLNNTSLTQKQLDKFYRQEIGYLYPDDCLKYGLCDWILESNGKFRGR